MRSEIKTETTWQNRAERAIAHGALTNSKRPQCFVKGVYPTHVKRGHGCHLWDDRGKQYIDFICGLGTNLLGYGNTQVATAMGEQVFSGQSMSLSSTLEVECAEKVKELFPFVERVRFLKTGSDACSAAVRIARAATGRRDILSEGYHGFHDGFTSLTPPALGVKDDFCFYRLQGIHEIGEGPAAAVIVEPVATDASDARREWLHELRKKCDETGTLLIFDEVITGFRFMKHSVSNAWGITPDLICLGKSIANGMPLSVVGGKAEVMECGEYFVSSTYAGETVSLSAALRTMTLLQTKYDIGYLWARGEDFLMRFNSLWPEKLTIEGYPTRGVFNGDPLIKALFWQESCKAGILFGPSWFFSFSHLDVTEQVLNTCKDIMTRIKTGGVKLEGELPTTPFAQKVRET